MSEQRLYVRCNVGYMTCIVCLYEAAVRMGMNDKNSLYAEAVSCVAKKW